MAAYVRSSSMQILMHGGKLIQYTFENEDEDHDQEGIELAIATEKANTS